ncbi:hypothetical protein V6582_19410 [Agrobacterium vitis]|nr:hypothetical protein [Agrobacterium vitis]MVA23498.1 hypothetical protein [Agrobacterium vitis]
MAYPYELAENGLAIECGPFGTSSEISIIMMLLSSGCPLNFGKFELDFP